MNYQLILLDKTTNLSDEPFLSNVQKISCISFVIQSEAKNLVNIKDDVYVNVSEILHFTSFRSE